MSIISSSDVVSEHTPLLTNTSYDPSGVISFPIGMFNVHVPSPLSTKFPSPSVYVIPFTVTEIISAELAVPAITGVVSLIV